MTIIDTYVYLILKLIYRERMTPWGVRDLAPEEYSTTVPRSHKRPEKVPTPPR
jgi:hypothetical protein